ARRPASQRALCGGVASPPFAAAVLLKFCCPGARPPAPARMSEAQAPARPPVMPVTTSTHLPLVSCIMPTRDRPAWMQQAVAYFLRQDYPERELLIVDDGSTDHANDVPHDPRVRYVHLGRRLSIGAKRNRACELAKGAIIAHWDDDDWYAAERLSTQVAPLLSGAADITALTSTRFFDLDRWEIWSCTPELHRRLFVLDVHGGTLVYHRRVFEQLARYPDTSLA